MTTTVAPLAAAGAVADALDDWITARGEHPVYWSINRLSSGTAEVTAHMGGRVAPDTLRELGLRPSWHFESRGMVLERWHTGLTSTTGASWRVEVLVEVGPVSECGHLLDEDDTREEE